MNVYFGLAFLCSSISGQSLVNIFAPSIVDYAFTGVLNRLEKLPKYENFTALPGLVQAIGDKSGNELIDILEHESLPEMIEPENWSIDSFAEILKVDDNLLDDAVDEIMSLVPANNIDALVSLLGAMVSQLDQLRSFLENGWDPIEMIAILYDYANTMTQFLQLFGNNVVTQLITQTLAYGLLATEKYFRIVETMEDNLILSNWNELTEKFSTIEINERICLSINNGFYDALDDFAGFITINLASFGDDLSYIVTLWNNLVSDLPFEHYLTIDLQDQCQEVDLVESTVAAIEKQISAFAFSVKLAAWPMRPFTGLTASLMKVIYTGASGHDCL